MRNLTNLKAIHAFDAAARHCSFAQAAGELGVSHTAVSRHVRNLETELGVLLFERHARHIALTGEGSLFARIAADSLSGLELGTGRMRRGGGHGSVILDVESDLATRWLMPLLDNAVLEALDVDLDIRIHPDPPRMMLGDADLALTWSAAACTGFKVEPFLDFEAFPIAVPRLLEDGPDPQDPEFFTQYRLIHERGIYWWRNYLAALGADFDRAAGHLFFNRSHLYIDAAVRISMRRSAVSVLPSPTTLWPAIIWHPALWFAFRVPCCPAASNTIFLRRTRWLCPGRSGECATGSRTRQNGRQPDAETC